MSAERAAICDYCGEPVHPDANGWWVGVDGTSDCIVDSVAGHEVDGHTRPL